MKILNIDSLLYFRGLKKREKAGSLVSNTWGKGGELKRIKEKVEIMRYSSVNNVTLIELFRNIQLEFGFLL